MESIAAVLGHGTHDSHCMFFVGKISEYRSFHDFSSKIFLAGKDVRIGCIGVQ